VSQAGVINVAGGGGGGAPVQTLTGNSGGPVPPTGNNIKIIGGNGINIVGTPGTSTLTVNVINDGFPWLDEAVSYPATVQTGYFNTGVLTASLPASAGLANGATIIFYVDTASVVTVQANAGQQINIANNLSSVGGTANSNAEGSVLTLVFRIADSSWHAISSLGSWSTT